MHSSIRRHLRELWRRWWWARKLISFGFAKQDVLPTVCLEANSRQASVGRHSGVEQRCRYFRRSRSLLGIGAEEHGIEHIDTPELHTFPVSGSHVVQKFVLSRFRIGQSTLVGVVAHVLRERKAALKIIVNCIKNKGWYNKATVVMGQL